MTGPDRAQRLRAASKARRRQSDSVVTLDGRHMRYDVTLNRRSRQRDELDHDSGWKGKFGK